MTFRAWLHNLPAHDNTRGDFIREVRRDKDFPDYSHRNQLETYLVVSCYPDPYITEFKRLWREFRRYA